MTCCVIHNILIDYDLFDEDDVEYGVLECAAALRAANSVNGSGIAGVRSMCWGVYLNDDVNYPEDIGLVTDESPLFHQCRADLIDHLLA